MTPYPWLLRNLILPLGDRILDQRMISRLKFLEAAQWWDAGRLLEARDESLRALVRTAYDEVPFYRDLIQSAGATPEDVRGADDLRRLPAVTKEMLLASPAHRVTRTTGRRTHVTHTSGSTGKNFHVTEDSETAGWHRASFLLAAGWARFVLGEPHLQTGMNLGRGFVRRLKDLFLRCHYVSAFDLGDAALDAALQLLETKKVGHLWGYPGSLYFLARRAAAHGWNLPLTSVMTWGDNLYAHYRRAIEQAFRTRVFDTYGCGEGMQIAAQCGETDNYHIHTLDVVVEILDEEGSPCAPGTAGKIVLTRLHPGPTPLIRYAIGDLGVRSSVKQCPCGRGFETIDSIIGRDTDVVLTPSGNRLIVHFFTGILEHYSEIDSFQVIQETSEDLLLRLRPAAGYTPRISDRVIAALREKGASDMRIHVHLVPEIPCAPSGKRRFVISKITAAPSPVSVDRSASP